MMRQRMKDEEKRKKQRTEQAHVEAILGRLATPTQQVRLAALADPGDGGQGQRLPRLGLAWSHPANAARVPVQLGENGGTWGEKLDGARRNTEHKGAGEKGRKKGVKSAHARVHLFALCCIRFRESAW